MKFEMTPIGIVRNERTVPIDDDWDRVNSSIELDLSQLGEEAIKGLHRFSHVEVVFVFDRVDPDSVELAARIGTTVCELMAVRPGGVIEVRGLDAIDGTHVLDIKPYFAEFAPRGDVRQPDWTHELMSQYWLATA